MTTSGFKNIVYNLIKMIIIIIIIILIAF